MQHNGVSYLYAAAEAAPPSTVTSRTLLVVAILLLDSHKSRVLLFFLHHLFIVPPAPCSPSRAIVLKDSPRFQTCSGFHVAVAPRTLTTPSFTRSLRIQRSLLDSQVPRRCVIYLNRSFASIRYTRQAVGLNPCAAISPGTPASSFSLPACTPTIHLDTACVTHHAATSSLGIASQPTSIPSCLSSATHLDY